MKVFEGEWPKPHAERVVKEEGTQIEIILNEGKKKSVALGVEILRLVLQPEGRGRILKGSRHFPAA